MIFEGDGWYIEISEEYSGRVTKRCDHRESRNTGTNSRYATSSAFRANLTRLHHRLKIAIKVLRPLCTGINHACDNRDLQICHARYETLPACISPKSRKKRAIKVSFPPSVFRCRRYFAVTDFLRVYLARVVVSPFSSSSPL